ncbi:hypothetical protein ACG3SL_09795 [Sphingomonas sp. CJ20]
MIKRLIACVLMLCCAVPAYADPYNFNFTFTNPGAVMLNDGLGSGTRTFSGVFTYDSATGETSFVSGTYSNANGSMALSSADVNNIAASFVSGATPRLNVLLFDWNSTLGGAEYADDVYSYSNGRLTWDSGLGSGQFERVTSPTSTYIQPVSVPEIGGPSLAGVAFILLSLLGALGFYGVPGLRKPVRSNLRPALV